MKIKKNVYTVRFFGPERYLAIKVLERELRKNYNVFGGKLVQDTKGFAEVTFTIHEDYRISFYDVNNYVGTIARNFCLDDSTDWEIVSIKEVLCEVKVID